MKLIFFRSNYADQLFSFKSVAENLLRLRKRLIENPAEEYNFDKPG